VHPPPSDPRDGDVPVACAEHVAAAIPGARLAVLPDCGHFAYLESPERVVAEVVAFLAGKRA